MISNLEGLLKRACDQCTKSKVRCSGHEPCKRCYARGYVCIYRPKKKRGPQKKKTTSEEDDGGTFNNRAMSAIDSTADYTLVSSYERRVWSVFFTIFKHQQRNRDDHPWAWCWFAQQLRKLRKYLIDQKNENALKRLNTWLEALDLDINSVETAIVNKCSFSASMCGSCSAAAMGAPNKAGEKEGLILGLHLGQFEESNKALLVSNNDESGAKVSVNQEFTDLFGYRSEEMSDMLVWSGGGFLPWGGDLLARLLVKETDLHVFLQILALKFQALGIPAHRHASVTSREIPTTHVFDLWCRDETGALNSQQAFLLRCLHKETIENGEMTTAMKIVFEPVGSPVRAPPGEFPVSFGQSQPQLVQPQQPRSPGAKRSDPSGSTRPSKRQKQRFVSDFDTIPNLPMPILPSQDDLHNDAIPAQPRKNYHDFSHDHNHDHDHSDRDRNSTFEYVVPDIDSVRNQAGSVSLSSMLPRLDEIPEQWKDYYDWSDDVALVHNASPPPPPHSSSSSGSGKAAAYSVDSSSHSPPLDAEDSTIPELNPDHEAYQTFRNRQYEEDTNTYETSRRGEIAATGRPVPELEDDLSWLNSLIPELN